ncbi:hypothetical protein [Mycolicibacterium thermoresistibile]|uniref:Uncharacterized protein n=2 Tax=Mycolicibacterium thermoresistibile TaxID=1797 RepID=G7CCY5_MYCT3|nr:hypothetical protein [Mycolicibacterium thermoresistibile]EHI14145.1 hypothetical protein KEK_04167 [Mycolicibacterium thermoresistibile ATCC 19527]MCV7188689.1 hypothetical protein [Mycolicibacterium thermoresistibile]GAT16783.1 putative uncharacterized protein [Mycolicibacterium thermoresistibile]SNW18843.1 Uncharacterised protein [Mycolicibacterium thermoresistibile]
MSWVFATTIGPFETTRLLTILLTESLPVVVVVEGRPREEVIGDLLPAGLDWWAALLPLPAVAAIWAIEAWRLDGFAHVREFVAKPTGR